MAMPIDKELAAMLACPKCRRSVALKADGSGFVCDACQLLYPIEDGIPNFLIEEARPLSAPTPGTPGTPTTPATRG
jgi:uncharacterized protein